jgi:3',5'-cyclic AMP phosphodiesterase CpdA
MCVLISVALALCLVAHVSSKDTISIGVVTDVHIGMRCNHDLSYENCRPVRTLTDAVNQMNTLALDGVMVSGDISDAGLYEEFTKAREILETLEHPWWPLFGNHDSWPYYRHEDDDSFNQTDSPLGDQYFAEIYGDILSGNYSKMTAAQAARYTNTVIDGWPTGLCLNQENTSTQSWFHNFELSFPEFSNSFKILNFDWVARSAAWPSPGVGPQVELHDYECGTTDWILKRQSTMPKNTNFFIFQHHPFHNVEELDPFGKNTYFNFTFDKGQLKRVQEVLGTHFPPQAYLGSSAGHIHRWFNGSSFTPFTASNLEWLKTNIPAYETPATRGWYLDPLYASSFTVFTFKVKENSRSKEVYLANVDGHWKTPDGVWELKPPFHNPY